MTVSGTANYATTYCYDAANRLLSENRTGDGSSETRYTYDADGNLLTRTVTSADGIASATYQYDLLGQLVLSNEGGIQAAYAYNVQGIRTEKTTSNGWTQYLLDGGNVIGEQTDAGLVTYLRGVNLILRTDSAGSSYYLFNAHGDVTELTDSSGAVTKIYHYDAFGVETSPAPLDKNPFRYCGEYFDTETGTYYLCARYYDPNTGRFTQQDTHWNTANSIYGDNPQKINEREDKLGLKTYSYAPQITAVMQSGNLYVYSVSNPVAYVDRDGQIALELTAAFLAVLAVGVANAVLPYLWKISVDFGKALAAFAEEFGAEIYMISKKAAEALVQAQNAISAAAAAPTPPPPDDPHSKGTRITSKTLYRKGNIHIDVENPGHRPGQIHLQIGREKYIYDVSNQVFKTISGNLAPRSIQALLNQPEILDAIMKGLTYLGY